MTENWLQLLLDQASDSESWPLAMETLRRIPWKDTISAAQRVRLRNEGSSMTAFLLQAHQEKTHSNRASMLLGLIQSPDCIPSLLAMLKNDDTEQQRTAGNTLCRLGDIAFASIELCLRSGTEISRERLLLCVEYFWDRQRNERTNELIEIIVQIFTGKVNGEFSADLSLRSSATNALMALGVSQPSTVESLLPWLESDDATVQLQVAGMLAAGEVEVERAIDLAIAGLKAAGPKHRVLAARVLGRIGESALRAVPALLDHLDEQDRYASAAIKKAIVTIGPIGIPEIVQVMNNDSNPQVRGRCAAVLSGPTALDAFDDLHQRAVHDPHNSVRFRASKALNRIKRKENPAYLEAILVNSDHRENGAYRWDGGKFTQRGTYVSDLWKCLVSNDDDVRAATFEIVKRFQLHQKEPLARWWVRGMKDFEPVWLVNDDPKTIFRRLEAVALLDQHLHLQETFLQQCANHEDDSISQLARQLLLKLE